MQYTCFIVVLATPVLHRRAIKARISFLVARDKTVEPHYFEPIAEILLA
jgi:hypothetical protein